MGSSSVTPRAALRAGDGSEEEARGGTVGDSPRLSNRRCPADAVRDRARLRQRGAVTILIDSNIAMYLVGADHPHKADARRLLESAIGAGERLVTDAEVLQEILHRYGAIDRRDAIQAAFDAVLGVV